MIFQRRLVIDSNSSMDSEDSDRFVARQTQRQILRDNQSLVYNQFLDKLQTRLIGFLDKDIDLTEQRILTGILTPQVSRIDQDLSKHQLQ